MKRLMLVWVMILCLMPLGAWAENETVEWFTGSGDMYNSLGEHYCFRIEDDHAVLTQYWVEDTDRQPSEILVSAALGGHPLTIIGWGAFDAADLRDTGHWYNDRKVERIILPEGVTTLENGAFLCANDVERIELPASLTEISTEGMTFYNIGAEIVFPNGNPNYQSVNGFLIDTRDQALLYCDEEAAEHPLPSVARIEKNALFNYVFNDASERTELVFPDSVTYIGGFNAYDDPIAKSRIERVIIPSGVTEIDDFAFYWCDATEIVLNEGLRRIGSFAFSAVDLQALGIPSSVEWIGYGATDPDIPTVIGPDCHGETKAEFCSRYRIHDLADAEVVERSASPFRMLEIVEADGEQHLRVTMLDGSGSVFTTKALPAFTNLDTFHDGGVPILMHVPVDLPEEADWDAARNSPETFDWDLVSDSEAMFLTFVFVDGEWRLSGATNSQDWYFTVTDGTITFDDFYDYDGPWQWQTTGEFRLTEIYLPDLKNLVTEYDAAMPDRYSLHPEDFE